jgi:glycyl-tRNA synthetase
MEYFDPDTNEKYIPYVVEPSLGVGRAFLAFLCDAYDEETLPDGDVRTVMHFHPALAPVKCAVLPLSKKLSEGASQLYMELKKSFFTEFDESGAIGRRYRRQDEIGTPFCVTYDFDTQTDRCVTVRDRDTMTQERVPMDGVAAYIEARLGY